MLRTLSIITELTGAVLVMWAAKYALWLAVLSAMAESGHDSNLLFAAFGLIKLGLSACCLVLTLAGLRGRQWEPWSRTGRIAWYALEAGYVFVATNVSNFDTDLRVLALVFAQAGLLTWVFREWRSAPKQLPAPRG